MLAFVSAQGFCLRDKVPSILSIIIWPAVYFRDLSRPVAMSGTDRSGPFQGSSLPGVLRNNFSSFENRIEEIEYEQQLSGEYYHGHRGDKPVEVPELVKRKPATIIQVTAWHPGQSFIV